MRKLIITTVLVFIVVLIIFSAVVANAATKDECTSTAREVMFVGVGDTICKVDITLSTHLFAFNGEEYFLTILKRLPRSVSLTIKHEGEEHKGIAYLCGGSHEQKQWYVRWTSFRSSKDTSFSLMLKQANGTIRKSCEK